MAQLQARRSSVSHGTVHAGHLASSATAANAASAESQQQQQQQQQQLQPPPPSQLSSSLSSPTLSHPGSSTGSSSTGSGLNAGHASHARRPVTAGAGGNTELRAQIRREREAAGRILSGNAMPPSSSGRSSKDPDRAPSANSHTAGHASGGARSTATQHQHQHQHQHQQHQHQQQQHQSQQHQQQHQNGDAQQQQQQQQQQSQPVPSIKRSASSRELDRTASGGDAQQGQQRDAESQQHQRQTSDRQHEDPQEADEVNAGNDDTVGPLPSDPSSSSQLGTASNAGHLGGGTGASSGGSNEPHERLSAAPTGSSTGSSGFSINSKRLSSGSAVAAAVRKLEEDARAYMSISGPQQNAPDVRPARERRATEEPPRATFTSSASAFPAISSVKDVGRSTETFENSFGVEALQAAFSAKYYELANKCKNWERYAAKLRAQAEALEVENRLLRDLNAQQEEQMARLEAENADLRDQGDQRESRAREVESRLSSLEERLNQGRLHHTAYGPIPHNLHSTLEASYGAPSPPESSVSRDLSRSGSHHTGPTYHSSNIIYSEEDRQQSDIRAPTPIGGLILPSSRNASYTVVQGGRPPQQRSHSGHVHRDSIIAQDAANRDFGDLYGEGRESRLGNHSYEPGNCSSSISASASAPTFPTIGAKLATAGLPVSSSSGGIALTSQALAAIDHQYSAPGSSADGAAYTHEAPIMASAARMRLPGRLTSSPPRASSVAGHKRGPSMEPKITATGPAGSGLAPPSGMMAKHRANSSLDPEMMRNSSSMPQMFPPSGPVPFGPPSSLQPFNDHHRVRSGSAVSDAATVTGWPHHNRATTAFPPQHGNGSSGSLGSSEYLSEQASQRRRLRRTSMSQQQQLAQLQAQREAAFSVAGSNTQPPSRSASRLSGVSNEGGNGSQHGRSRSKARSRAGSASVHDAIPTVKDDIFSDDALNETSKQHSSSIPHSHSQPALLSGRPVGSLAPPPGAGVGKGRISPLMPLSNVTNVQASSATSSEFPSSMSEGNLALPKPSFGRTASATSLTSTGTRLSETSSSHHTTSSGHPSRHPSRQTNLSSGSGFSSAQSLAQGHHSQDEDTQQPVQQPVQQQAQRLMGHAHESSYSSSSASGGELLAQLEEEPQREDDRKGAHRRLYIALRDDLPPTELARFERYVHRYDAGEIPIDGPRGLINRVKKLLLLTDPTLRQRPADLRRRKDLARAFENVVKNDLE